MKHEQKWRLRAEYVRWVALLSPEVWLGVQLEHCWIDGRSAYAFPADLVSSEGSTVNLKLPSGVVIPVAFTMLGPEERRRVQREADSSGKSPHPKNLACA